MVEREPYLAKALDHLVPPPRLVGDWDRVLRDAAAGARVSWWRASFGGRRRGIAVAVAAAALAALASIPAIAVVRGWWFLGSGSPRPASPIVTVASGRSAGIPWKLTAFRSERTGICVALTPKPPAGAPGGAEGCGFGLLAEISPSSAPKQTPHQIGYVATSASERLGLSSFVFGPTAPDVRVVQVELSNGRTIRTETLPAPKGLGLTVRFYVAQFRERATVRSVTARDASGTLLERRIVPQPHKGQPSLERR
jgi:hypothetical protein